MLFGVLVGVTLLGIGLTAAVTLWSQVVQREGEAELLFRGEAIVRALERFQRDRPGALPETLDELVEGRYLRRAWLDPLTGRSFRILRAEGEVAPLSAPGSLTRPEPTDPAGARGAGEGRAGRGAAPEAPIGIVGVASTSELLSFRTYRGARRYSDWRFEAALGPAATGASPNEGGGREPPER